MKRLTWKEIQEKYPDQWLGLTDVKFVEDDGITIESAVVKYADKSKFDLDDLMFTEGILSRYTTPDHVFQLGAVGGLLK